MVHRKKCFCLRYILSGLDISSKLYVKTIIITCSHTLKNYLQRTSFHLEHKPFVEIKTCTIEALLYLSTTCARIGYSCRLSQSTRDVIGNISRTRTMVALTWFLSLPYCNCSRITSKTMLFLLFLQNSRNFSGEFWTRRTGLGHVVYMLFSLYSDPDENWLSSM